MFGNKKEMDELKQEITDQLSGFTSNINQRLQDNENSIKQLKEIIVGLNSNDGKKDIVRELQEINTIKSDFERALGRVNSMSNAIENKTADRVKEVTEAEIDSIKKSSEKFREIEDNMIEVVSKINSLQLELSKFISISQQIKLVDYSLKNHKEDVENYEKERNRLTSENDDLKSKMAKMIRDRY